MSDISQYLAELDEISVISWRRVKSKIFYQIKIGDKYFSLKSFEHPYKRWVSPKKNNIFSLDDIGRLMFVDDDQTVEYGSFDDLQKVCCMNLSQPFNQTTIGCSKLTINPSHIWAISIAFYAMIDHYIFQNPKSNLLDVFESGIGFHIDFQRLIFKLKIYFDVLKMPILEIYCALDMYYEQACISQIYACVHRISPYIRRILLN